MIHVLSACDRLGRSLTLEGDNIRVEGIARLPENLKTILIENKSTIIKTLERDDEAQENVLMVGRSGLLYTWTVSHRSTAYMEYTSSQWIAWRETYREDRTTASAARTIAYGATFEYVLMEFKKYIDYVTKERGERK